jgi:plastocyanin
MVGVVLLISAGCGDPGGTEATSPTESPSVTPTPTHEPATCDEPEATTIELVASSVLFNVTCLVVPAGEPLDVTLRNEDGVNHNFSIYTLEFASAFTGEISFGGETFHYDVPALEPGEYLFQCDIHPREMEGPLIVR